MSLALGVTLPQFTGDAHRFVHAARSAEDLGLDSIWLFDHLWPLSGGKARPFLECWTALAWIARSTTRIRVGTLVTRSSLRHPVLLAKMAATVAEAAPGRIIVGIGSGDALSRPENEAFGLPYYESDDRVSQLRSAVNVVRSYLTEDVVTRSGATPSIRDLPSSPRPDPPPPVWVAGRSDDVLELAGEVADGWNAWGSDPASFARDAATVLEFAHGRPVTLSWGGQVLLAGDATKAGALVGTRNPDRFVVGGPDELAERLAALRVAGAHEAILAFPDAAPERYELLATRVRPLLDTP